MSGDPAHAVPGAWSGRHAGERRSGARAVSAPPLRYPGGFLRCPPVVLGEDQLHRPLERGARRARASREPFLELDLRHAEKGGELRPPALEELTLLENPGAHLRPSGVVDHCHGRANEQSAFQWVPWMDLLRRYCSLMPAARTICSYSACSVRRNSANCAGVYRRSSAPCSSNLPPTSGDESASFSSLPSRSTIAAGVFAGAKRPVHATMSKPLSSGISASVGISGALASRCGTVMASAFTLPAFTCGSVATVTSIARSNWLPMRSLTICAPPL